MLGNPISRQSARHLSGSGNGTVSSRTPADRQEALGACQPSLDSSLTQSASTCTVLLGARDYPLLAVILVAFIALQSLVPLRTAVQIGADEGFELAKATLCLKGYKLYTQAWNDQPPLHTFIVTEVLERISPSILGPRLVTSAFTVLLLASLFTIIRRTNGGGVAILASALLLFSPGFVELSASCMLEIPALATGVAARVRSS